MYRFYLAAMDMLPGAALMAPIFMLLNRIYFHNPQKSILYYLFSCYLSVVYVLVGLPNVTYMRPELNLNLIPFRMFRIYGYYFRWGNFLYILINFIGNMLVFLPLGFFPALLFRKGDRAGNLVHVHSP